MYIVGGLYIAIIILGIKRKTDKNYLSKNNTLAIRGLCAIAVLLSHLRGMLEYLNTDYISPKIFEVFSGSLSVAVFFFLSGYGLNSTSEKTAFFFKKRFIKVIIPYVIANIIYFVWSNVAGSKVGLIEIPVSIFKGTPLVTYSWYIIIQLLFYFFFWLAYSITKKKKYSLIVIVLCQMIYIIFAICIGRTQSGWTNVYYHGCLCFALGCFVSDYKTSVYEFITHKNVKVISVFAGMITCLLYVLYKMFLHNELAVFDMSGLILCITLLFSSTWIISNNRIIEFWGMYSLEIYLYQALVMRSMKIVFQKIGILNSELYSILSVVLVFFFAYFVKKVTIYISSYIN